MATVQLSEMTTELIESGLKELDCDLEFLLTDRKLPQNLQACIAHAGLVSLGTYRHLGKDEADVRENFIEKELGILPSGGREARTNTAKILDSWTAAKKRAAIQDEAEGEQRAMKLPRSSLAGVHVELRTKFEKVFGDTSDLNFPAESWIDARLDQFEMRRLLAESLREVVSVAEAVNDVPGAEFMFGGKWTAVKKGRSEVPLPKTP